MFGKPKTEINTSKLYYGFPIIFLGYKDDKFKYNATTTSSSYSLGNTINVGIVANSCAANYIKKYKQFSVNVPCENLMSEIEICGFFSGHNKLQQADLPYTLGKYADVPLIDECFLNLECVVTNFYEDSDYLHIIGEVKRRVIFEDLVANDGKLFLSDKIQTVHFTGCASKRIYRYLDKDNSSDLGSFVEGEVSNCG